MRLLCVDTSTFFETVALTDGLEIIAERCVERRRGHATGILDDVVAVLADAGWQMDDIEGYACGLGPGGFTGLRIGLSTAKGFALALNRPLFGARSTQLLLAAAGSEDAVAIVDARRDEVYLDGGPLDTPVCTGPATISDYLDPSMPWVFVGDGAVRYRTTLENIFPRCVIAQDETQHRPRAGLLPQFIDRACPASATTLEPVYIRKSDAEMNYPDGFPSAFQGK
ncbi:MAG: tRNA (adenosine(37)-N6)-threonylcarbamoyltransferase complex dimerization subunit type 1 TsaB [Myxococcota bacterium]|nr:tRNA (adenosine(37)-N6)-threonylcarbamoyltransferase complex dimerization subunit type 1 TsaB [Myxococcota bacterium]